MNLIQIFHYVYSALFDGNFEQLLAVVVQEQMAYFLDHSVLLFCRGFTEENL